MSRKIFIVEDDPIIASDLEGILNDLGYQIAGIAHEPITAKKQIENCRPDLLLMDIDLGSSIDGVELAGLLKNTGAGIIFITAFTDKKTRDRVKEIGPLGYIIKPFDEKDVEVALDLAFHKLETPATDKVSTSAPDSVFIRTGNNSSRKIIVDSILFMEAYDNYAFIHTADEKIMVSFTLKDLEARISAPFLVRVHRSFVVNTARVDSIHNGALVIGKNEIPVGKSYREEVMKIFPTL